MQKNDPNKSYLVPTLLALCLSVGLVTGYLIAPKGFDFEGSEGGTKYQKLQDIIEVLDQKYVDKINAEKLFEETISDMLHRLDPHSNYIPAKDLARMNEQIEGKFGGIGVRFFILRDTICVTHVIPGSPSEAAGLKAGDKIIQVDGKRVTRIKITNEKVMSLLKGQEGTTVALGIKRKNNVLKKSVVRGSIPIESVECAHLMKGGIGYIRISEFSVTTADEFRIAADKLKSQGMKKLLLDLRNNTGGVMQSCIEIADELLPNEEPIVVTKGTHSGKKTYYSKPGGMLSNMPLVVLINVNSASASEILAGAIQDNDRGTIVGRRSFGKGLVQEDVPLRDGSNLRLTVARYYTPTGRCIQRPYKEGYDEYMSDQLNRMDNEEMYKPDKSVFHDSLKFRTPKGKIVYGGGGIMPDVFVPFDSAGMNLYYTELMFNQVFTGFAFDMVHGSGKKWKSIDQFIAGFNVSDVLLQQFVRFAYKEFKVKPDANALRGCRNLVVRNIKAEMARQIWLENGFFKVVNLTDNEVQAAIKAFKR
jgi:carboxyl-terminal processing protease